MDKFSYAIGLGIGQNLLSMGAKGIAVDDFAQAIKDVLEGNQTAISHTEARDIVNKYFAEMEEKMNAANILIEVADKSAYSLGYLLYFFEFACGVSGYVLGVNPFNQPGVEAYKKNMFALLGKPGYEAEKAALEARLN